MKKFIGAILITILFTSAALASVGQQKLTAYRDNIKIIVDGLEVLVDEEPFIVNGRTMIPLRPVVEALGASVEWDGANGEIKISSFQPSYNQVDDLERNQIRIKTLNLGAQFVTIENPENTDVDLSGWKIVNKNGTKEYVFPNFVLKAGSLINVRSGAKAFQQLPTDLLWSTDYIWDLHGDKASLRDTKGNIISEYAIAGFSTPKAVIEKIFQYQEIITIKNNRNEDLDMTGWKIETREYVKDFVFPNGFILKANERVNIRSGPGAFEKLPTDLKWTNEDVWHDNRDSGSLLDSDRNSIATSAYQTN